MRSLLAVLMATQILTVEPRHITIACLDSMEAALMASHDAYMPKDYTLLSSGSVISGTFGLVYESDEVAKLERELAEAKSRKAATEERSRREDKARATYETALDQCGRRDFSPVKHE